MAKAKKKTKQIPVSQEDNVQAQPQLEQYHEVASNLRTSKNREQAEAALTDINNMPEGAQIALLKALSKEHHVDAADFLLAINELSPTKSVRKEARRSLIRLEGARIYPSWKLPVPQPFAPAVLKAPDLISRYVDFDEESEEESPNLHDLSPQEVVTTFLESYVNDDYPTAYNLLAQDSLFAKGSQRMNGLNAAIPGRTRLILTTGNRTSSVSESLSNRSLSFLIQLTPITRPLTK